MSSCKGRCAVLGCCRRRRLDVTRSSCTISPQRWRLAWRGRSNGASPGQITRRTIPQRLHGRDHQQAVAGPVHLARVQLAVQTPAQPDARGNGEKADRHQSPDRAHWPGAALGHGHRNPLGFQLVVKRALAGVPAQRLDRRHGLPRPLCKPRRQCNRRRPGVIVLSVQNLAVSPKGFVGKAFRQSHTCRPGRMRGGARTLELVFPACDVARVDRFAALSNRAPRFRPGSARLQQDHGETSPIGG